MEENGIAVVPVWSAEKRESEECREAVREPDR